MKLEELQNNEKLRKIFSYPIRLEDIDESKHQLYFEILVLKRLYRELLEEPKPRYLHKFIVNINDFWRRWKDVVDF